MPDHRKPPLEKRSRSDAAPPASDAFEFSIESTTMRLKSMKLRRAEAEQLEADRAAESSRGRDDAEMRGSDRPAGRVRHDERGVAVWDFAVATGEFATLSATRAMKKLEVADLEIQEHKPPELKLEKSGRDQGGGFDPYNQLGSGKRQGEAAQRAGVTGAPSRDGKTVLDQLTGQKK